MLYPGFGKNSGPTAPPKSQTSFGLTNPFPSSSSSSSSARQSRSRFKSLLLLLATCDLRLASSPCFPSSRRRPRLLHAVIVVHSSVSRRRRRRVVSFTTSSSSASPHRRRHLFLKSCDGQKLFYRDLDAPAPETLAASSKFQNPQRTRSPPLPYPGADTSMYSNQTVIRNNHSNLLTDDRSQLLKLRSQSPPLFPVNQPIRNFRGPSIAVQQPLRPALASSTLDNRASLSGNNTNISGHQVQSSFTPQFGSHNPPWSFTSEPNSVQVSKRIRSPPLLLAKSNEVLEDEVNVARKDLIRTRELLTAFMSKIFFSTISHGHCLQLLEGCFSMRELKQIHAHAITDGLARFAYVASRILAFCVQSQHGDLQYADTLFNHMPMPNVFDCNSMIMGFSRNSEFHRSLSIFNRMHRIGIRPNARTFTFVVKACVSLSLLEQVHTQILKFGNLADVYVVSSALNMYSKHGAIETAHRVFDESSHKNVVCWTSLISGYCGNGLVKEARDFFDAIPQRNDVSYSAMVSGYVRNGFFNEGIDLFRELKSCRNLKPNKSLLVTVLNACAAVGAFEEGKWIHSYIDYNGFEYELETATALIDFYAKCGCVQAVEHVFSTMSHKDVTTWSAMILGLGINGNNEKAIELFAQMEKVGPKPNAVTLVGVLNACNHKFLLNEAWRLFGRMSKVYDISPCIEHYGCMVDILARAGKTREAEVLIKSMPMEPDGAIWGSLLNGCLMHGDSELGLRVGKILIELEPQHSGRYVLLANMYASMGKWDSVSKIRKMMKDRGVVPISAWSFIEIDRIVHKFVVDDKSHSNSVDIYSVLSQLGKELEDFAIANDAIFI